MEELRRALAEAKAARLQGEATIRTRSSSRSPGSPDASTIAAARRRRRSPSRSPPARGTAADLLAEQRQRLADADASALVSRAEQAIEARRRQISSFGADAPPPAARRSPERPPSPMLSAVSHDASSWDNSDVTGRAGSADRTPSPRSPEVDAMDRSWDQLHAMNERAEWRLRPDGRSPSPPRQVSQVSRSHDSSLSPQSNGPPQRRAFEPVSADQRILQRMQHPERERAELDEDWAERGDYTFHPLTGSSRRGPDGKQSVLARAKRYLRQHAGLEASTSITPDIVERLIATEVEDGYVTAAQARKVSRQVGDAQIMSAFNAIQAASFARRNTPATPKQPDGGAAAAGPAANILSPETRVLLDAGLSMQEVNSLKDVGALGPPKTTAAAAAAAASSPVPSSPKSPANRTAARMSPARTRMLAKPKTPGGFGRGRSPERYERPRASSRPKPKQQQRQKPRPLEPEPLDAALSRASAADEARAAAMRAAEAAASAGAPAGGAAALSLIVRETRPPEPPTAASASAATYVAPPAVDPAFSSFLDRTEEWSAARERKAEEKRNAVERRAMSAGTSKRLATKEQLQGLVNETTARQEKWEQERQMKLEQMQRQVEEETDAMRTVGSARKVITASEAAAAAARQAAWEEKRQLKLERAREERDAEVAALRRTKISHSAKKKRYRPPVQQQPPQPPQPQQSQGPAAAAGAAGERVPLPVENTQVVLKEPVGRSLTLSSPAYAPSPPREQRQRPQQQTKQQQGKRSQQRGGGSPPTPEQPQPQPQPEPEQPEEEGEVVLSEQEQEQELEQNRDGSTSGATADADARRYTDGELVAAYGQPEEESVREAAAATTDTTAEAEEVEGLDEEDEIEIEIEAEEEQEEEEVEDAELVEISALSSAWLSTAAELLAGNLPEEHADGETKQRNTTMTGSKSKLAADYQEGRTWAREAETLLTRALQ
jgi:hypothetical protein